MRQPQRQYEILLQPRVGGQPTSLHVTRDVNDATMAFHAAMERLCARDVRGELHLLMHNHDGQLLLLRQPLEHPDRH